jgi:D-alanyl-D-alanine carboxypeptidase
MNSPTLLRGLGLVTVMVLAACAPAGAPPASAPTLPAAAAAALDSIAAAAVEEGATVGIAIGVARDGVPVHTAGHGFADLGAGTPVTDSTVFRIGSITKQFTAAAILRLAEEGRLTLDDDISRHLPEYPTHGRRITIHHLLNHTSGIHSYTSVPEAMARSGEPAGPEEVLAMVRDRDLDFEPGASYAYNNTGYFLLGLVIEAVTGEDYAEHLDRILLRPLGLRETGYCPHEPEVPRHARGYRLAGGEPEDAAQIHMGWPYAAGALCSSVRDLLRWEAALRGGEVISTRAYERMATPSVPEGSRSQYGYGLVLDEVEGAARVHHGGGIPGFVSQMAHYADAGVTVVALTNVETGAAYQVEGAMARAVGAIPERPPFDGELTREEMERYVGRYATQPIPMRVRIEDGVLMAQGEGPGQGAFPLVPLGEHEFGAAFDNSLRLVFTVEGDGAATDLTIHQAGMRFAGPREDSRAEPGAEAPLPEDAGARYGGRYDLGILEIRIFQDGDALLAQAAGQEAFPLRHLGDDTFGAAFDPTLRLAFDLVDGRAVTLTLTQQGQTFSGQRVD